MTTPTTTTTTVPTTPTTTDKSFFDYTLNEMLDITGDALTTAGNAVLDFQLRDIGDIEMPTWGSSDAPTPACAPAPVPQLKLMPPRAHMSRLPKAERLRLMREHFGQTGTTKSKF